MFRSAILVFAVLSISQAAHAASVGGISHDLTGDKVLIEWNGELYYKFLGIPGKNYLKVEFDEDGKLGLAKSERSMPELHFSSDAKANADRLISWNKAINNKYQNYFKSFTPIAYGLYSKDGKIFLANKDSASFFIPLGVRDNGKVLVNPGWKNRPGFDEDKAVKDYYRGIGTSDEANQFTDAGQSTEWQKLSDKIVAIKGGGGQKILAQVQPPEKEAPTPLPPKTEPKKQTPPTPTRKITPPKESSSSLVSRAMSALNTFHDYIEKNAPKRDVNADAWADFDKRHNDSRDHLAPPDKDIAERTSHYKMLCYGQEKKDPATDMMKPLRPYKIEILFKEVQKEINGKLIPYREFSLIKTKPGEKATEEQLRKAPKMKMDASRHLLADGDFDGAKREFSMGFENNRIDSPILRIVKSNDYSNLGGDVCIQSDYKPEDIQPKKFAKAKPDARQIVRKAFANADLTLDDATLIDLSAQLEKDLATGLMVLDETIRASPWYKSRKYNPFKFFNTGAAPIQN